MNHDFGFENFERKGVLDFIFRIQKFEKKEEKT